MTTTALSAPIVHETTPGLPLVLHTRVVTGAGGGPDKTILNSPRFLPELGYRSVCAYMRPPGDEEFDRLRCRAREARASLVEVDDRGPLDLRIFQRHLELCRERRVAVWHAHDYKSNLIGLWVRRHWPMKLVTTVHGWVKFTRRTPLYYAIDRLCLPRYDRVICVSDDLADACRKARVPAERIARIDNAIDTQQFRRTLAPSDARRALGLNPDTFLVGGVGRLSEEKGFDVLIRSVAELVAGGRDVALAIAGEGDERQALERLIEQLGLQDRVRLLGFCIDTVTLFQAFDAFALSSHREGLPNVVLEAMALETPIVATRVAGVPKVISDGHNGLLVPAADVTALAGSIARLYDDLSLRMQLAREGLRTIESRFSFATRMKKVARVYDEVLS